MLNFIPALPNPDPAVRLIAALILLPTAYAIHIGRGTVMEFVIKRTKYYMYGQYGHDKLYKVAYHGAPTYKLGAVRILRAAYALAEGASMVCLATGLAALATFIRP